MKPFEMRNTRDGKCENIFEMENAKIILNEEYENCEKWEKR